ncbi:MAG: formate dehydrogenase accessory protein FdhE [Nitrospirae bacterium]|nr:formate dehydrogenase accessory protein FdhE [Nitrospirota bacterium]
MNNFESYKKYLEDMTRCFPNSGEMVNLYNGLIDIWGDSKPDDLSPLFSYETPSPLPSPLRGEGAIYLKPSPLGGEGRVRGLCLLDENKINEIDFTNSSETAIRVFKMMCEKGLKGTESLNGLSSQQAVEVIKMSLNREDRHRNVVIKWILKPSFMNLIEKVSADKSIKEILDQGIFEKCPLCNAPPGMAIVDILNNTVQRFLSCGFCGFRWPFTGGECPDCRNNKPEKMSFIVGDSACEQGSRAVCCDECKRYIKTVFVNSRKDGRGFNDIDTDIEDVATIPLDIIAGERGYIAVCQSGI